ITGLQSLEDEEGITVFHAGTSLKEGTLVSSGGRVLGVTAMVREGSLGDAIGRAYEAVAAISFDGMHYRRDIGRKGLME
ncbi:MAG: phosphoribosylamine--glycine ligase, partial [Bacteroidetes bacterium]|nr:phosphoribosylamine--glycine ligase [Bacteroidota bacterium]